MSVKPRFGYWDLRGYGQPTRFLLAYSKVDYEETVYDLDRDTDWTNEKFTLGLPFPNLPYWIDDNVRLTESFAIFKHVARKYNPALIPSGDKLSESEMLEGVFRDIWKMLVAICYTPSDSAEASFNTDVPVKLGQLDKFIGKNSFVTGNNPSYIDFVAYEVFYHLIVLNAKTHDSHPNIVRFMKNFEALPAIAAYMKSPQFIKAPCFSKHQQKYHI